MKPDRLGLLMIGATLGVIALIIAAVMHFQGRQHQQQLRAQGSSLVRALASVPVELLAPTPTQPGMLRTLAGVQRSADLAYALWVSPQGQVLAEVAAPDVVAPVAPLPTEPAQWFGERELRLAGDDQKVLEFHAPVMAQGALAGFVRLGYRADPPSLGKSQLTFQALLALPIFLLAPMFYGLIRREMRPLAQLGQQMQHLGPQLGQSLGPLPEMPAGMKVEDFVQRFGKFLEVTEARMRELESERVDTLATQRLLAYRKNRVESVLHALPEGVLVLDADGIATFANAKVEPLLGATPEQIVGRAPHEWCRHPELLAFLTPLQWAQTGETPRATHAELSLDHPTPRHLVVVSQPLLAPNDASQLFGTLVVVQDDTQDRLVRGAGAEFVANVSHELKTPLHTLTAYSELLMDSGGSDESLRVEAVNVIHAEVGRMAGLINNLLNISKLETGAIALAPHRVNVHDLLHGAFEALRQSAVGKGLGFRIDVPANIGLASLDKDLLRIALNNLLSNAIKYNKPGGEVLLSAREGDDDMLEIRVRDSGIGIPPEHCARIFDKYYRVEADPVAQAGAGTRSGHGLGLYLARQIVELHHGSISVESNAGQGTEFCIHLRKISALYEDPQKDQTA